MFEFQNIIILIVIAAIAYILNEIIWLWQARLNMFNFYYKNKNKKNDISKFKFKRVNNKVYDYFYTIAITTPELLAKKLTKDHMINLYYQNKIDDLYSSIKTDEKNKKVHT